MALLDKQKILNELGNVVSQLQRADCGCMGRIFGNNCPDHGSCMAGHCGGEMRNYWGHGGYGYNAPCAGEPFARQCAGFCTPSPKLYADTYNYVNKHLMQPTIHEVYEDLKSLTPANTVMNNPLASQMGLSRSNNANQSNIMAQSAMAPPQYPFNTQNMQSHNSNYNQDVCRMGQGVGQMGQGIGHMGQGMGQMGQGMGQMDYGMGQMGYGMGQIAQGPGHMEPFTRMMEGMGPQIVNMMRSKTDKDSPRNMPPQDMGQSMPYMPESMQDNGIYKPMNMQQQDMYSRPQQMGNMNAYGNHNAGMAKFNDMFPDAMKKDLGYDPMSIAMQMQDQQKFMSNSNGVVQPIMNANAGHANVAQPNHISYPNDPAMQPQKLRTINEFPDSNIHSQQVRERQEDQNQYEGEEQHRQEYIEINAQDLSHEPPEPRKQQSQSARSPSPSYREPIFPAILNKNANQAYHIHNRPYYEYNPLGQLVERINPRDVRDTIRPSQPYPARMNNQAKYSTVKSTVSKTSLMGNVPIGKTPSRSQLQNIYNQYKGSHSFTKQNINTNKQNPNVVSYSEGHIKINNGNSRHDQIAVERVAGDTSANKQVVPVPTKLDSDMKEVVGDVPMKPSIPLDTKTRNGLQDQVFTSPPASSKWSFHGVHTKPYSPRRYHRRRW